MSLKYEMCTSINSSDKNKIDTDFVYKYQTIDISSSMICCDTKKMNKKIDD